MKKYRVFLLVLAVVSLGIVLSGCMNLTQPPQAPTYSYPSIGQTNVPVNPTLSWSDPGNNLTYDVYFGTSSNPPLVASGLTGTSYTPSNLAYSTTYYWKVVAKNSAGSKSGQIWSFTTMAKPTYTVSGYVSDNSGGGMSGVTMSFSGGYSSVTTDLNGYWSKDKLSGSVTVTSSKSGWTLSPNSITVTGARSDVNFTGTQNTPPPGTPSNPSPSNGETNVSINPTLSWSDSGNNLTYDVYFGTSSNPPLVASGLTGTSYTPSNLAYSTTYYWKVVAKNSAGSKSGQIWSFTTKAKPAPSIPNVTGSWSLTVTWSGQSPVSGNVLLLQNQDNKSNVAMIEPIGSQSWYNGGWGITGTINGNQITLTGISNGQSGSLQGTISNGVITGTVNTAGQSGTFQMSNMQPLTVSQQSFNIIGIWQFTLNDQTSGNTFTFTTKIYQDGSDVVNVVTSSEIVNSISWQGYGFFGTLQGNSITFNLSGDQLTGTLLTNHSISGSFTIGSDTGTWSATFISSYQSKKQQEIKKQFGGNK